LGVKPSKKRVIKPKKNEGKKTPAAQPVKKQKTNQQNQQFLVHKRRKGIEIDINAKKKKNSRKKDNRYRT
jgi:hypothetical protein